jgi:glycine/D-amino acid oxidase-like deaminating enzyme
MILVHRKNIVIVGAGIIGTCCAYFLQKEGHKVTVIDRNEPGTGASYGNAGSFSDYSVLSLNTPDIFLNIPYYLLSSNSPLSIKLNYIFKLMPWMMKFLRNCTNDKMLHTAKNMKIILEQSISSYEEIFSDIDVSNLYEKKGVLYLWGKNNLKSYEQGVTIRNQLGVKQKILSKDEIKALEPNINPIYEKGVLYESAMCAKNPKKILQKIFDKFLELGGTFVNDEISEIKDQSILGKKDHYEYDKLIISAGAFSKKMTDQLGENIPLETERGYHVHFKNCEHLVSRGVCFADSGLYLTPMEQGLRAAGTVELGGLDNPPSKKRIDYVINQAKLLINNLPEPYDSWMGFRPTLPDFLPVIGKSKFNENIFYAFGHNHLGWTLGAITGKVIRDSVIERKSNFDLSPFLSSRF